MCVCTCLCVCTCVHVCSEPGCMCVCHACACCCRRVAGADARRAAAARRVRLHTPATIYGSLRARLPTPNPQPQYGYRMSKTALNMAGKLLSEDLAAQEGTIAVGIVHPGPVSGAGVTGWAHRRRRRHRQRHRRRRRRRHRHAQQSGAAPEWGDAASRRAA